MFSTLKNKYEHTLYTLMEWTASALSFICLCYVYKVSTDMTELQNHGIILNIMATSLCISGAVQYYVLHKGVETRNTFVICLIPFTIELFILRSILSSTSLALLAAIIVLNIFYAAYRGLLISRKQFISASTLSISEQALRLIMLVVLFYVLEDKSNWILLSTLCSYAICTLFILPKTKWSGMTFQEFKLCLKDISLYIVSNAIIYIFMNFDILATKELTKVNAEIVLVKPWGTILCTLVIPLMNILLVNIKTNSKSNKIIKAMLGLIVGYIAVVSIWGRFLSNVLFAKVISHTNVLFMSLLEHLSIAVIVTLLYICINKMVNLKKVIGVSLLVIVVLFVLPKFYNGIYILGSYIIILSMTAIVIYLLVLGKKTRAFTQVNSADKFESN